MRLRGLGKCNDIKSARPLVLYKTSFALVATGNSAGCSIALLQCPPLRRNAYQTLASYSQSRNIPYQSHRAMTYWKRAIETRQHGDGYQITLIAGYHTVISHLCMYDAGKQGNPISIRRSESAHGGTRRDGGALLTADRDAQTSHQFSAVSSPVLIVPVQQNFPSSAMG